MSVLKIRASSRTVNGFTAATILCMFTSMVIVRPATAQVATQDDGPTMADGQQLIQQQNFDEAARVFQSITVREPNNGQAWLLLGYSLHGAGDLAQALPAHLMAAEFPQPIGPTGMYNAACVYSLWNRPDRAFQWLNRSIAAGFRNRNQLVIDTDMDNIRDDERFQAILDRLAPPAPRPPASADAESLAAGIEALPVKRQLDFWVGSWNVVNSSGVKVGTNVIEKQLNDHMILESWTSATGGGGKSMNYFDPHAKSWTQIWVDASGGVIIKEGGFKDGAMRMEGRHILPSGEVRPFRTVLTPKDDGTVHQFIQESTDGGETWNDWFEGTYVRASATPATGAAGIGADGH